MSDLGAGKPTHRRPMARFVGETVVLEFEKFNDFIAEYSDSISLAGMFIPSGEPLEVGSVLQLHVRLKDGFRILQGSGQVVWTRADPDGPDKPAGMGIRFHKLDDSGRTLINKIVYNRLMEGGRPFELGDALATSEDLSGPPDEVGESATATHPLAHPSNPAEPITSVAPAIVDENESLEPVPTVAPPIADQEDPQEPVPTVAPPIARDEKTQRSPAGSGTRMDPAEEVGSALGKSASEGLNDISMDSVAQELEDSLGLAPEAEPLDLALDDPGMEETDDGKLEFGDDSEITFAIVEQSGSKEEEQEEEEELLDEEASGLSVTKSFPVTESPGPSPPDDALWEPPAWSDSPSFGEPPPELPEPGLPEQEISEPEPEEEQAAQTALFDPASPDPIPAAQDDARATEGLSFPTASLSAPPPPTLPERRDLDASILSIDRGVLADDPPDRGGYDSAPARTVREALYSGRAQRRPRRLGRLLIPMLFLVILAALGHLFFDELLRWAGLDGDHDLQSMVVSAAPAEPGPEPTEAEPDTPSVEETALPETTELDTAGPPEPDPTPPIQGRPEASTDPEPPQSSEPPSTRPATALEDVTWSRSAAGLELALRGNGAFRPEAFRYLKFNGGDPRLLIRLIGVTQPYPTNQILVGAPEAGQIRIGFHEEKSPPELHIVVDLASVNIRVVSVEARGRDIIARLR